MSVFIGNGQFFPFMDLGYRKNSFSTFLSYSGPQEQTQIMVLQPFILERSSDYGIDLGLKISTE